MHTLQLNAADTLFFRDGRPFTMGEDTAAEGFFPPPPSVIYGALRTAYMSSEMNKNKELDDLITESDTLHIHGICLENENELYLPMPNDLVVSESNKEQAKRLKFAKTNNISSNQTIDMLINTSNEKVVEGTFLLSLMDFQEYLTKPNKKTFPCINLSDWVLQETKIGIGRSNETHIAGDGMLYRMRQQRLKTEKGEVKIIVNFDMPNFPTEGVNWLQLGGERKAVSVKNSDYYAPSLPTIDKEVFKIYLSTPAIFTKGWMPSFGSSVNIIAAAIGKPIHLGGFDVQAGKPKPMLQAVPAGSVYYLKAESVAKAQELAQKIHGKSISEFEYTNESKKKVHFDTRKQGMGIAWVGTVNEHEL